MNCKLKSIYTYVHMYMYMYIYTVEYYSTIKRNKIESFVETWMDLGTVIQSEVSQKGKNKYRTLTRTRGI